MSLLLPGQAKEGVLTSQRNGFVGRGRERKGKGAGAESPLLLSLVGPDPGCQEEPVISLEGSQL